MNEGRICKNCLFYFEVLASGYCFLGSQMKKKIWKEVHPLHTACDRFVDKALSNTAQIKTAIYCKEKVI